MKYSDYQLIMTKEYKKNRSAIFTCYIFIFISIAFYAIFFLSVRDLTIVGAAFCLDFAAAVYAFRAFKSIHPYWEMQKAIKVQHDPTSLNIGCLIAAIEYACDHRFPPFKGRSREILLETYSMLKKIDDISKDELSNLERVMIKAAIL